MHIPIDQNFDIQILIFELKLWQIKNRIKHVQSDFKKKYVRNKITT